MKRISRFILSLLVIASISAADSSWKKIDEQEGIEVFRKETPGSSHLTFRSRGAVNKEMFLVMAVIGDLPNVPKWVDRVAAVKLIREISDRELIFYNHISAPWPLNDRDVVLHTKVTYDHKNDWIHIDAVSVKNSAYPPGNGKVRIPYMTNHWSLKPIRDGKATWVEFQVQADPGGIIPAWAANMTSKEVPYKTLANLRKRVASGKFSLSVLKKIKKYALETGLVEKYKKKYGGDYIKEDDYYLKTYKMEQ